MIIVMEEAATDGQISHVIDKLVNLGFDIHRSTGATYTILGAVGSRAVQDSDVRAMEMLDGVKDIIRVSGPSVKKIKRPLSPAPAAPPPPVQFPHITIFGVGLIGGSFALAVREARLASRITGCGDRKFLEAALVHKVIDGVDESFTNGNVSDADLIYLSAPVGTVIEFLKEKGRMIKPGAIVTDAGSAKQEIWQAARQHLPAEVHFIGGHPMAGSHRVGVEFANAELFKNAPYVLVPPDVSASEDRAVSQVIALEMVKAVVEAIGSRVVLMTASDHDAIAARISHVPQLLSTALVNAVEKTAGEKAVQIAGNGFWDMARLARSEWSVWEDIVKANAEAISEALGEMIEELHKMHSAVSKKEFSSLKKSFESAKDFLPGL